VAPATADVVDVAVAFVCCSGVLRGSKSQMCGERIIGADVVSVSGRAMTWEMIRWQPPKP